MEYGYPAWGCFIVSEVPLPGLLEPLDANGDLPKIRIRWGNVVPVALSHSFQGDNYRLSGTWDDFVWEVDGLASFRLSSGSEIAVELDGAYTPEFLGAMLVGRCLPALIWQRGLFLLHASGVCLAQGAIGFCGESHMGKSTLVAALATRGYPLVSDDVLAVHRESDDAIGQVLPGWASLKLWDDVSGALPEIPGSSAGEISPEYTKRRHELPRGLKAAQPLPLLGLYMLEWGDEIVIERLPPIAAFAAVVAEDFADQILPGLARHFGRESIAFQQAAGLADQVSVYRFARPRDASRLSEGIETLLAHLA